MMLLSAEQFERILTALRSDGPDGARDKRRRPRVGLRASIKLIENAPRGKGARSTATIRDISREGIGIHRAGAMKPGQRFLVQLPSNDGTPKSILCTVRHCESVTGTNHHIGATFVRVCSVSSVAIAQADALKEVATAENARIRQAILS
jgi:hypothetical protein